MAEAALYTDTQIVGELEVGPLKFINTIAHRHDQVELRPAIVLRLSGYWPEYNRTSIDTTSDDHYHGGDQFDEIAALASLILGIRLQAGPITRDFGLRRDPLGTPINLSGIKAMPTLFPSHQGPMVPRLNAPVNLTSLSLMGALASLSPEAATAVVKAARNYQTALWFADSHPEMAWLFLVSSIETAAQYWAKQNFVGDGPFLPDAVADILREHNCPESVDGQISKYLRETTRSTQKFVQFLITNLPDPPEDRPEPGVLRVEFKPAALEKDFRYIYRCRSRSLHTGVPFPKAMCMPRHRHLIEERILALSMSAQGATWNFRKYKPIAFHLFEHIARGSLLRWFEVLARE